MENILIPLGVCVVLPVLVVWLVTRAKINSDNRRAEVLLKAIEAGNTVDAEQLAMAFSKSKKITTPLERNNNRLTCGSIFSGIGLVLIVIGIIMWFQPMCPAGFPTVFTVLGGISAAIGAGCLITWNVTRKQL